MNIDLPVKRLTIKEIKTSDRNTCCSMFWRKKREEDEKCMTFGSENQERAEHTWDQALERGIIIKYKIQIGFRWFRIIFNSRFLRSRHSTPRLRSTYTTSYATVGDAGGKVSVGSASTLQYEWQLWWDNDICISRLRNERGYGRTVIRIPVRDIINSYIFFYFVSKQIETKRKNPLA